MWLAIMIMAALLIGALALLDSVNRRLGKLERWKNETATVTEYNAPLVPAVLGAWRGAPCRRCGIDAPNWFVDDFGSERICKTCTDHMPYPLAHEDEDMYVERYKKVRAEQRAKEERKPA